MQFSLNFQNITQYLIPELIRKAKLRDYLFSAVKPLKTLNTAFVSWKEKKDKIIAHSGIVIEMERYLNDEYGLSYDVNNRSADITAVNIIWIDTVADIEYIYLYNKIEEQDAPYIYNKYKSGTTYSTDERIRYGAKVYKSLQDDNTGNTPDSSPTWWEEIGDALFLKNKAEVEANNDFIVKVPSTLTYDEPKLKAQINLHRIAGKRYEIQTYS